MPVKLPYFLDTLQTLPHELQNCICINHISENDSYTQIMDIWSLLIVHFLWHIGFEMFSLSMFTRSCSKFYWNKIKISCVVGGCCFWSVGSTKCTRGIDENKLNLPFSEELPENLSVRSVNFWMAKLSSIFAELSWCGFLHSCKFFLIH